MQTKRPFIIGVAGGSGSGKTTVTKKILETLKTEQAVIISQDNYYNDQSHLSDEEKVHINYDHPHAFDNKLLLDHISKLYNGEHILMPTYQFETHSRASATIFINPAPVIVIEGLFALYDQQLRDLMSLKLFVDTESDVRLIRRIRRDTEERQRSLKSVLDQYEKTVRPMYTQFIEPTKQFADLIIPRGYNGPAVDIITTKIQQIIKLSPLSDFE